MNSDLGNNKDINVLIVEDQHIIVADLVSSLYKLGYKNISHVDKGKDAILYAIDNKPDIILMDIYLKDNITGIEAAKIINRTISIPIIYITANSDEATLQEAKTTDPYGFLTKPINMQQLYNAMQIALYKHSLGQQLIENERWLNTTLSSISDAVIATDIDGYIKFMNYSAEKITGWKVDECIGKELKEVFHISGDKNLEQLNFVECFSANEKRVFMFEDSTVLITKNNKKIPIEGKAAPIVTGKNINNGCVIVFTDCTEKKRSEEKLRLNQERLRVAIQNSALIVFNQDENLVYKWVYNFEKYFGDTEILGKKDEDIFSAHDAAKLTEIKKQVISEGEGKRIEIEISINNKKYFFDTTVEPLFGNRKKIIGITGSAFDITLIKEKELELLEAKEKAESGNRLKTEFLSQVSHEIRTPVNNILGFTNLLKDEFENDLPKGLENSFVFIDKSAKRLIRTIDLIINLSKILSGNYDLFPEEFQLDELLDDLYFEFLMKAKEKGIELKYEAEAKDHNIKCDRYSISQSVKNIIENGIKYTEKGSVVIKTFNEEGKLILSVSDTGVGMSKEFIPTLYSPFSREVKNNTLNYEGTGLGLALVKKLLDLNGVNLEVKSEKFKGTEFQLIFENIK